MKALIIEDEGIAAKRLTRLINSLNPNLEIVEVLDSIRSSIKWLNENDPPDLAFFDIQLADGKSFEIFKQVDISFPIIFTTAYDQYAIDAFKVNAVDYLLKPIAEDELKKALEKFQSTKNSQPLEMELLKSLFQEQTKKYKERFVVKIGDHIKSIMTTDTMIIYGQEKGIWVSDISGKTFLLDYTMDQVGELIDPNLFFRISRKYIINIESIEDIMSFSNSRLKLKVKNFNSEEVVVARERVSEFKNWLDR